MTPSATRHSEASVACDIDDTISDTSQRSICRKKPNTISDNGLYPHPFRDLSSINSLRYLHAFLNLRSDIVFTEEVGEDMSVKLCSALGWQMASLLFRTVTRTELPGSASSRIRFLPVQAQPTAARSSRRAVVAPRGRARSSHWAIFLLNDIAITNNSTFPKIKLHYSISYCNKTKSNNFKIY